MRAASSVGDTAGPFSISRLEIQGPRDWVSTRRYLDCDADHGEYHGARDEDCAGGMRGKARSCTVADSGAKRGCILHSVRSLEFFKILKNTVPFLVRSYRYLHYF